MLNIKDKFSDVATYTTGHGTQHRTLERAEAIDKLHKHLRNRESEMIPHLKSYPEATKNFLQEAMNEKRDKTSRDPMYNDAHKNKGGKC